MKNLVFLLEEPSAKDLLQALLPRFLPEDLALYFLVFEGKQDLERQMERKIRGWRLPNTAFIVLRDQDAADCRVVKSRLVERVPQGHRERTLVRVACRELESWIIGDWFAVAEAFARPDLAAQARKEPHRMPDRLVRPVEILRRFIPEYQKRDGARRVGPLLNPSRNQSESFRAFYAGLHRLFKA